MLRAIHTAAHPVKIGHSLLLASMALSCQAYPYEPVSTGASGYLSDRAWEVVAEFPGSTRVPHAHGSAELQWRKDIDRDVAVAVDSFAGDGKPLFLERAWIGWQLDPAVSNSETSSLGWKARVHSYAFPGDLPAGSDPAHLSDGRLTIRALPETARRAAPDYRSLAEDGVVRVGALFGQMNEPYGEADDGFWSRDAFELDLSSRGYEVSNESPNPVHRTWEKEHDGLRVIVEVAGPDAFPLDGDPVQARNELRSLVAQHEMVYLNAHANQPSLDAFSDPLAWQPPAYRVVMLDVCWSYFLYARQSLDAAGWSQTHLVVASGRVVTGSVESFASLLHGLVGQMTSAATGERPEWLPWIAQMNDLAGERARARAGQVSSEYAQPEVYGVSGLWRP